MAKHFQEALPDNKKKPPKWHPFSHAFSQRPQSLSRNLSRKLTQFTTIQGKTRQRKELRPTFSKACRGTHFKRAIKSEISLYPLQYRSITKTKRNLQQVCHINATVVKAAPEKLQCQTWAEWKMPKFSPNGSSRHPRTWQKKRSRPIRCIESRRRRRVELCSQKNSNLQSVHCWWSFKAHRHLTIESAL